MKLLIAVATLAISWALLPDLSSIPCSADDANCNTKDRLGANERGSCIRREILAVRNSQDIDYVEALQEQSNLYPGNVSYFCYPEYEANWLIELGTTYLDIETTITYNFTEVEFVPPQLVQVGTAKRKVTSLPLASQILNISRILSSIICLYNLV